MRISLLLIPFILLASACGYQPVRSLQVSESMQPIYVRENSPLAIEIKRQLIAEGIATTKALSQAGSIIELANQQRENRYLTVNNEGRNTEGLQQLGATFVWRKTGGAVILQETLNAETIQVANPDKPLAARNEADSIYRNLNRDIASQALRLMHQSGASE